MKIEKERCVWRRFSQRMQSAAALHPLICTLLLLLAGWPASGQNDTTLLLMPEKLSEKDIQSRNRAGRQRVTVSATRSAENVEDLPFNVWVVTSEEILLNGYVTLADVLRAAPGIRVSQPGNATEGETFLMRGLSGNRYVKILINDVPVKPSAAWGMPIGAQLPIRQAERIEVYYGPAAAIYGNEACAGVVNIVLKESERPIFTQADLSFGSLGYNSLDLTFGGKLGKDKKIFRFTLYGSSTVRDETDLYYDRSLYQLNRYLPLGLDSTLYTRNANFRATDSGDSLPKTVPIPHESRLFGVNLTWRGLHFTYHVMRRRDFSSLGLNPLAVSWSDASNRIDERLETYSLGFQTRRRKYTVNNNLSLLRYNVDKNSTQTYIFNGLSSAAYYSQRHLIATPSDQQAVLQGIHQRYNSNERYMVAQGFDVRWESLLHSNLSNHLFLDAGIQLNLGGGTPLSGHFNAPVDLDFAGFPIDETQPFGIGNDGNLESNFFVQTEYRNQRFRALGGVGVNLAGFSSAEVSPRLALLFRIDSSWTLFANAAKGIRRPSVYEKINTLRITDLGVASLNGSPIEPTTERIISGEFGLRSRRGNSFLDLLFFGQNAYNLSRQGYLWSDPTATDSIWYYGFRNAPGLSQRLYGIQGRIGFDTEGNISLGREKKEKFRTRMEYHAQYTRGSEFFGYGLKATTDVRNLPRWVTQFRASLQSSRFDLMVATTKNSSVISQSVPFYDVFQRTDNLRQYPKFRTWDVMGRLYLSNHFLLYIHVLNLFDREYSGLDATGTTDDLLYNPQQGRIFRLGVNYNMN